MSEEKKAIALQGHLKSSLWITDAKVSMNSAAYDFQFWIYWDAKVEL